jgi:hypothetical protein
MDMSNLRINFTHVCQHATLEELEIMLRVIAGALDGRFNTAAIWARAAGDELRDYRDGKRGSRNTWPPQHRKPVPDTDADARGNT